LLEKESNNCYNETKLALLSFGGCGILSQIIWLALGYNVPVNPSKNRVYVWRKLKEIGACYFRPGVAILPKNTQGVAQLGALCGKIREMGGEAVLADLRFIDPHDEARTIKMFREQSRDEYLKLIHDCKAVMERLGGGLRAGRADILRRAPLKLKKIKSRDYFKYGSGAEMAAFLDELAGDIAHGTGEFVKQMRAVLSD
jgi:hypothetical protein